MDLDDGFDEPEGEDEGGAAAETENAPAEATKEVPAPSITGGAPSNTSEGPSVSGPSPPSVSKAISVPTNSNNNVKRVKRVKVSTVASAPAPAPVVPSLTGLADSNTKVKVKSFVIAPFFPPASATPPLVPAASAERGKRGKLSISETTTNNDSNQPENAKGKTTRSCDKIMNLLKEKDANVELTICSAPIVTRAKSSNTVADIVKTRSTTLEMMVHKMSYSLDEEAIVVFLQSFKGQRRKVKYRRRRGKNPSFIEEEEEGQRGKHTWEFLNDVESTAKSDGRD
ncbi:hypothetical protein RIF29_10745 [Crotalaria pallida]|uniref:Uncharacterized protein n=1 Tax=Crotalaria pallida TaxID=3830 RepID=A0AAN9IKV4_CROPI